jgi:hypothetical protein
MPFTVVRAAEVARRGRRKDKQAQTKQQASGDEGVPVCQSEVPLETVTDGTPLASQLGRSGGNGARTRTWVSQLHIVCAGGAWASCRKTTPNTNCLSAQCMTSVSELYANHDQPGRIQQAVNLACRLDEEVHAG